MAAGPRWVWTATGVACLPDSEEFGDPAPGDPFTEQHHGALQDEVTGPCDHETLAGMDFIALAAEGADPAAVLEDPAFAKPPRHPQPAMRQLRDMSEEEFGKVPKSTPAQERPKFRNRKLHREATTKDLPGRHFGLVFPYTIEKLQEAGAEWLTQAFHVAGTIPQDNRVTFAQVIPLSLDPLAGEALGGSSIKCRVDVAYAFPSEGLHTKLFGKIPLIPTDTSERFEHHKWFIDEPESMFNRLLSASCPFRIPKTYFTDHCPESTNFLHLTEWIEYSDEYEPKKPWVVAKANKKIRDYDLPRNGVERYMALFRSLGRFQAAFWNGTLGDRVMLAQVFENLWPTCGDPKDHRSGWPQTPEERAAAVKMAKTPEYQAWVMKNGESPLNLSIFQMTTGVDFVLNVAPQLFGKECREKDFLHQVLKRQAFVMQHAFEIEAYTGQLLEMTTLFHPNVQLDNGYYYYVDEECKQMEAGIFDWGGAAGMKGLASMANNLQSGAEPAMLDEYEADLVRAYVDAFHESGGTERLTYDLVYTSFKLAQASGCAGTMGFIVNLLKDVPKTSPFWKEVPSRFVPEIEDNYVRRALVGQIDHTLEAWRSPKRKLFETFEKWTRDNSDIIFKRPPLVEINLPVAKK